MNTPTNELGDVSIQTIAMPQDANWYGDIFGGWLVSQMDLAGAVCARKRAPGRVATIAIEGMTFVKAVPIGSVVTCRTRILSEGNTSMRIAVDAHISHEDGSSEKVTEGVFVFVAIDDDGNKRALP